LESGLSAVHLQTLTPEKKMATPKKQSVSFSASNSTSKYAAALEFEQGDTRDQDNDWETETNISEIDDTRKQLEDLQVESIFSLVEDLEIDIGSKTMKKKLLFILLTRDLFLKALSGLSKQGPMFRNSYVASHLLRFGIWPLVLGPLVCLHFEGRLSI
jgi:hypothetical protein